LKALRAAAEEAGRPDLLLANNEYGLVKPPTFAPDFDRYTKAMVVTEFALEMYVSGYDMAAFWDTSDGGHLDHSEHMLTDTSSSYRFNPMHFGLEFLGRSTNGTKVQMTSGEEQRVHGFAAVSGTSDSPVVIAYLLNKYAVPRSIQIEMEGIGTATGTARNATAESVVDTADHWGGRFRIPPSNAPAPSRKRTCAKWNFHQCHSQCSLGSCESPACIHFRIRNLHVNRSPSWNLK